MGQEESQRIKNQIQTENKFPFLSKTLFDFLYVIGRGGFGKVWKVRYKRTQKKYKNIIFYIFNNLINNGTK